MYLIYFYLFFQDGFGRSPLHCCAKSGSVETVQMLVSLNCDLSSMEGQLSTGLWVCPLIIKKIAVE